MIGDSDLTCRMSAGHHLKARFDICKSDPRSYPGLETLRLEQPGEIGKIFA